MKPPGSTHFVSASPYRPCCPDTRERGGDKVTRRVDSRFLVRRGALLYQERRPGPRWFYEQVKVVLENHHCCTPTARPSIHPAASLARHARNARALTALPQAHMCMRVPIEGLVRSCQCFTPRAERGTRGGHRAGAVGERGESRCWEARLNGGERCLASWLLRNRVGELSFFLSFAYDSTRLALAGFWRRIARRGRAAGGASA
jgi:hypothetical protein